MRFEWDLDAFAPDSELERVQNEAHQGPDDASALPNHYDTGTDDVVVVPEWHCLGSYRNVCWQERNSTGLSA